MLRANGSHFGVSRTAVRGAIAIVERDHLVELRRNHGSFVASPDRAEARQLLETRRILEPATVAAVMMLDLDASPDNEDALSSVLRKFAQEPEPNGTRRRSLRRASATQNHS